MPEYLNLGEPYRETPHACTLLLVGRREKRKKNYILIDDAQSFAAAAQSTTPRSVIARPALQTPWLQTLSGVRLLSDKTRSAITEAVGSAPVVLFMKGTPETPQCGFSRASIQVLGMQGVDPKKFAAFNVLEDAELRAGT